MSVAEFIIWGGGGDYKIILVWVRMGKVGVGAGTTKLDKEGRGVYLFLIQALYMPLFGVRLIIHHLWCLQLVAMR